MTVLKKGGLRFVIHGILHAPNPTGSKEAVGVEERVVVELLGSLPHLLRLPSKPAWFDFDEEAGVLYVSFERHQAATDSELPGDGVVLRYRGDHLVGVTTLNARKRLGSAS
jgi:hypothetical protein